MRYNNFFKMQDLFCNDKLSGILPQFSKTEKTYNIYSSIEIRNRVEKYLQSLLSGEITADGEIECYGKKEAVMLKIRRRIPYMEALFNSMTKIESAVRKNTKVYLPYANVKQVEDITDISQKMKVINEILDNFNYNKDLNALNSVYNEKPAEFTKHRQSWERKVGYRGRLKEI